MKRVEVWIQGMYVRTFEGFSFRAIEEAVVARGFGNKNGDTIYVWG